jgi:4'-phosphopantetheinyl transferase
VSLSEHEMHVWTVTLDGRSVPSALSLLSEEEQARAARLASDCNRRRWVMTRAQLRVLLSRYLQVEPRQIRFSYGHWGRPELAGPHSGVGLHFSLARSAGQAIYLIACVPDIGVDLEYLRCPAYLDRLAAAVLGADERAALQACEPALRAGLFLRYWTRREALLKATGRGLRTGYLGLPVPRPGVPVRIPRRLGDHPPMIVSDLESSGDWVAAVATPESQVAIKTRHLRAGVYGDMAGPCPRTRTRDGFDSSNRGAAQS